MISCSRVEHRLYSLIGSFCSCVDVGLPKWPGMVVTGDSVTREQAAEIIVRTDSWYFGCNDRGWEKQIHEALGVSVDEGRYFDWQATEDLRAEHRVLDLEFLTNSRIASSFIGGANGWCSWDGQIYSINKNIGKWPASKEVAIEWATIATAFPFLNLVCQLHSGESCEEDIVPVIEYVVENGHVTYRSGSLEPLVPRVEQTEEDFVRMFATRTERGCTIDQFKEALKLSRME